MIADGEPVNTVNELDAPPTHVPVAETLAGRSVMITGACGGMWSAEITQIVDADASAVGVEPAPGFRRKSSSDPRIRDWSAMERARTGFVEWLRHAVSNVGRMGVLVDDEGIVRDGMIHRISLDEFRHVLDVHLKVTGLCTRAALPHREVRAAKRGGAIDNMSSISGKVGGLGQSNYAAAKSSTVALPSTAPAEQRHVIRADAILPGFLFTEMPSLMRMKVWERTLREYTKGRAGEPDEVLLAPDIADHGMGAVLDVSDGRHA